MMKILCYRFINVIRLYSNVITYEIIFAAENIDLILV